MTFNSLALWAQKVLRPLLPVVIGFNLEGEPFSERWPNPILRERRDMDKNFLATLGGRDEPETPFIIPF